MNHNTLNNEALLTAYALGELSGNELREVEALIASSPEMAAEVNMMRETAGDLERELCGVREEMPPSLNLLRTVKAELAARPPVSDTSIRLDTLRERLQSGNSRWRFWINLSSSAAILAVVLTLAAASMGNSCQNLLCTLAVMMPGAQMSDDQKLHSAQLIEFTSVEEGTFRIDDNHIGSGATNRLGRKTALEVSNADSTFILAPNSPR